MGGVSTRDRTMNHRSTMTMFDAVTIAAMAHAKAPPRTDGPYIAHPLRVMLRVDGDDARMAALLHDVVEDHADDGWTFDELERRGCPERVLQALRLLTHEKPTGDRSDPNHIALVAEDYAAYIERLAGDPIARAVKLADLADNIGDGSWAEAADAWRRSQFDRYMNARARLEREENPES